MLYSKTGMSESRLYLFDDSLSVRILRAPHWFNIHKETLIFTIIASKTARELEALAKYPTAFLTEKHTNYIRPISKEEAVALVLLHELKVSTFFNLYIN